MKTHEYMAEYGEKIFKEARDGKTDTLNYVFSLFSREILDIARSRNVKTKDGLMHIVEEQNEKWNAFSRKFRKKYGRDVVRLNALKTVYEKEVETL